MADCIGVSYPKNIETCLLRRSRKGKTIQVLAIGTDHLAYKMIKRGFWPEVICSMKICHIKAELNAIQLNRSVNKSGNSPRTIIMAGYLHDQLLG